MARGKMSRYPRAMKHKLVGTLLFAAASIAVPASMASATGHPSLTMAKGRQLILAWSQQKITASGGGYATVGRCGRRTAWKIECVSSLVGTSMSQCVMLVTVWNTAVAGGYYSRRYSYRGLVCTPSPAAPPPAPPAPPAASTPTAIPLSLVRSVADAYVGGIMRNAHSTVGGVDYCNYPIGFSGSCSYSFSGNRIADGSYYRCTGNLAIGGSYAEVTGWQTTVDYGSGPQCF
jgi:hypothetical protein